VRLRNSIFELFERTTTLIKKFVEERFFIFYWLIFLPIFIKVFGEILINKVPREGAKK